MLKQPNRVRSINYSYINLNLIYWGTAGYSQLHGTSSSFIIIIIFCSSKTKHTTKQLMSRSKNLSRTARLNEEISQL